MGELTPNEKRVLRYRFNMKNFLRFLELVRRTLRLLGLVTPDDRSFSRESRRRVYKHWCRHCKQWLRMTNFEWSQHRAACRKKT